MSLDIESIKKIAFLARLKIPDEEAEILCDTCNGSSKAAGNASDGRSKGGCEIPTGGFAEPLSDKTAKSSTCADFHRQTWLKKKKRWQKT